MTRRRRLSVIACALWLATLSLGAAAAEIHVRDVSIRLEDGVYLMDGHIDFDLSDTALEALDNGVPLTFELHVQVRRAGAWIWEGSLYDQQVRHRISYKPLSERYSIDETTGDGGSFVTRDAALAALGTLRDFPLVEHRHIDPDEDYAVEIHVALDIDELPLPLRPIAYLKPSWKLESKWSKWPLEP
ncbi:DUF4390 domain-containing protein [Thiococcus pfennigii]|jgi:hypothetical protein|uniref:DUF4390 domain-containing protein n=1 Tax=Thiococcus pfennigii TaxID=1057 RepID=UPI001902D8A4|nr:DUF4390 domain-containing protein [Thiococcus pfennigii]MBK1700967.1 hypothetical protein [Thiococcus pfennigii]MBK1731974.1 hypothetical protein [Thiococcus pfennigii]